VATKKREKSASPPSVRVAEARLTNPDKLLYPEAAITKRQVAEYYEGVSEWLLPHIRERPTTFVRCQNGWTKGGFFQKHPAGGLAKGVRVFEIGGDDDVLLVDDKTTLVALAQMCVLEIHTWGSHVGSLDVPDFLIFDLDPDAEVPWSEVVATASLVRERLISQGYDPLVKTTGGKGLHIGVEPIRPMTWDEARDMGRTLGESLVAEFPSRYVTSVSKAVRKGKILLDFARNHRQATFVAPYSPRARAHAPVATPLEWDELIAGALPSHFTIANVVSRLRERGDPWRKAIT
jgi:bifunctional non-homologous end joining protein LigD